jgi:multisubunit Na+/H+ antiporter MnhB subunit
MSAPEQPFQPPPPPPMPQAGPKAPRPTKLRLVAIPVFVIGLIILIGGVAKFLPGGAFAGAVLAFCGIVLFGLSFVPLPQVETKDAPMSTAETLMGIFFEPGRVFRSLRARPRWVAAFIIIAVLSLAYTVAFVRRVTPERIVNFTHDKLAETGFLPAQAVEQERQRRLEEAKNPVTQTMSYVQSVSGNFLKYCAVAGLVLLAILAFGGRMNFWQAFAAVIYAALPWMVIQKILSLVLLYVKSPEDIHPILNQETLLQDNLGVLVNPATHPVLFVLASAVGVLWIYWMWMFAKGLHLAGTKVSGGAAWGVTVLLTLLLICAGVGTALVFSGFMS